MRMQVGFRPRTCPASHPGTTPVMWSSATTASSARPRHRAANMPMAAERQPMCIHSPRAPAAIGGGAGPDGDPSAGIHGELGGQRQEGGAGDAAPALGRAREVLDADEGEHLEAVLGGGDAAHLLALSAPGAEMAVGPPSPRGRSRRGPLRLRTSPCPRRRRKRVSIPPRTSGGGRAAPRSLSTGGWHPGAGCGRGCRGGPRSGRTDRTSALLARTRWRACKRRRGLRWRGGP